MVRSQYNPWRFWKSCFVIFTLVLTSFNLRFHSSITFIDSVLMRTRFVGSHNDNLQKIYPTMQCRIYQMWARTRRETITNATVILSVSAHSAYSQSLSKCYRVNQVLWKDSRAREYSMFSRIFVFRLFPKKVRCFQPTNQVLLSTFSHQLLD